MDINADHNVAYMQLNRFLYISNTGHYKEVLSRVQSVKRSLWIGTADIKDLYVEVGKEKKPFLSLIAQLIHKGVEVRLIHAKEPGPAFREDFDKYPVLYDSLAWSECFVRAFISKCLSSTAKRCILAAQTLLVPVLA